MEEVTTSLPNLLSYHEILLALFLMLLMLLSAVKRPAREVYCLKSVTTQVHRGKGTQAQL
jgi:hypothetical protein